LSNGSTPVHTFILPPPVPTDLQVTTKPTTQLEKRISEAPYMNCHEVGENSDLNIDPLINSVTEEIDVELLPSNRNRCVVAISVHSSVIRALADSGADACYISHTTLVQACGTDVQLQAPPAGETISANQSPVVILGRVVLPIMLGGHTYLVNFHVAKQLSYPVILGWEQFISRYNGVLNSKTNTITLDKPPRPTNNIIYLEEEVILAPRSESFISACRRNAEASDTVYVTPFAPNVERLGVSVRPGIIQRQELFKEWTASIVMGNLTGVEVRLPKYTIVGINTACECEKFEPCPEPKESKDNNSSHSYRSERETRSRAREIALQRKSNGKTCVSSLRPRSPKQILVIRQERLVRIVNDRLNKDQIETIEKLVNDEYGDLFAQPNEPTQSQVINVEHEIDTGDARPVNKAPYRASPAEREIIRIQVAELKKKGIIQLSKSPWAAGIVLVKKKDGSVRFCLDYRSLNALTKRDVYPLPRIDDSLAALRTGVFFSTMDMQAGYYQVPMAKTSMEKTAFITEDGLYEFRAMPFGLTNAPATFQRFMDATCAGLKW
jgi:hypothetical protein